MTEHDRVLLQLYVTDVTHNIIMSREVAERVVAAWKAGESKIEASGVIDHRDANAVSLYFDASECPWISIVDISGL